MPDFIGIYEVRGRDRATQMIYTTKAPNKKRAGEIIEKYHLDYLARPQGAFVHLGSADPVGPVEIAQYTVPIQEN